MQKYFSILKSYLAVVNRFHFYLGSAFIISALMGIYTVYGNFTLYSPLTSSQNLNQTTTDSSSGSLTDQPQSNSAGLSSGAGSTVATGSGRNQQSASSSTGNGNGNNSPAGSNGSGSNGSQDETLSATVAYYADSQTNDSTDEAVHQNVVNNILATSANPVFHAGDLMEDGTQASLDSFNAITASLRSSRSFYSAIGNNERNSSLYFDNFSYPGNERWFSVNSGNLHMVILDSAYSADNASQLAWLDTELQSAESQNRITGIIYHHPSSTLETNISQTLIDHNADFVIRGHVHSYGHTVSNGIHYFTLSGQQSIGYILGRIYSSKATFTAYDASNNTIETINVANR